MRNANNLDRSGTSTAPSRVSAERDALGNLAVECWCRLAVVYVPQEKVMACKTESCGATDCKEGVS